MKTYIVGHIDWSENELRLERHSALTWQAAVAMHSKYPWRDYPKDNPVTGQISPEDFRQTCFDCDCMMNWIEI